jgi:hypothetical protein
MTIRRTIATFAIGGFAARVLPAAVRNRAYRMLINELIREAKAIANSREIFLTPAMLCDRASDLKVVSLVSGQDLEMLLWCLKSLFFFSKCSWDLWILDGGLSIMDRQILKEHFPQSHICIEPDLTLALGEYLTPYHEIREFRTHLKLARKLIDAPLLLQNQKFLLVDSDVLFFQNPGELIDHLRRPEISRFVFNMEKGQINSGVAVISASLVSLDCIERALRSMPLAQKQRYWTEQDLYTAIAQDCFDELSSAYAVEPVQPGAYGELVSCHFISTVRHRFYQQGVKQLRRIGFLERLRSCKSN